jgi:hypothetical protein
MFSRMFLRLSRCRGPSGRLWRGLIAGLALSAMALAHASSSPPPASGTPCDRKCLIAFVDQYLNALVVRDFSRLPVSADLKFTENTQRLNLGQGLWLDASGLGAYRIYLADPYSNRAGFLGVVLEGGKPKLFSLRLQIKNGKIIEIETIIARQGFFGDFPVEFVTKTEKPIWQETLSASERVPRLTMIAAANQYFEGMEQGSGEGVPFDTSCNRTENGVQTTNNPSLAPPQATSGGNGSAPAGSNFALMGCRDQFNHGNVDIFSTPERQFWMVDEERGLVFGLFMFRTKGVPATIPITELFKVKSGRIFEIEAVGVMGSGLPVGSSTGW